MAGFASGSGTGEVMTGEGVATAGVVVTGAGAVSGVTTGAAAAGAGAASEATAGVAAVGAAISAVGAGGVSTAGGAVHGAITPGCAVAGGESDAVSGVCPTARAPARSSTKQAPAMAARCVMTLRFKPNRPRLSG